MKAALRSYREALADNQTSEPARTRAALLTAVLEKQVCHVSHVTGHVVYPLFL